MNNGTRQLRNFQRRLATLANAPIATDIVEVLGDVWVDRSQETMGKDTWQLFDRTQVESVTGTAGSATAELVADTPYAGWHNDRHTQFWEQGEAAARVEVERIGGEIAVSVERVLESGGVWNPPRR